jgi:hypothetical protein
MAACCLNALRELADVEPLLNSLDVSRGVIRAAQSRSAVTVIKERLGLHGKTLDSDLADPKSPDQSV